MESSQDRGSTLGPQTQHASNRKTPTLRPMIGPMSTLPSGLLPRSMVLLMVACIVMFKSENVKQVRVDFFFILVEVGCERSATCNHCFVHVLVTKVLPIPYLASASTVLCQVAYAARHGIKPINRLAIIVMRDNSFCANAAHRAKLVCGVARPHMAGVKDFGNSQNWPP